MSISTIHPSNFLNISINKVSATVLAKMLVRALVILLWANDHEKIEKKIRTQRVNRKRKFIEMENLVCEESSGKNYKFYKYYIKKLTEILKEIKLYNPVNDDQLTLKNE